MMRTASIDLVIPAMKREKLKEKTSSERGKKRKSLWSSFRCPMPHMSNRAVLILGPLKEASSVRMPH